MAYSKQAKEQAMRLVTERSYTPTASALRAQQDRLLNLRLLEEIDADTFARKGTEMRDRISAHAATGSG